MHNDDPTSRDIAPFQTMVVKDAPPKDKFKIQKGEI